MSVTFFSISFGSMSPVSISISAKTGVAPTCRMVFAVDANVSGVVMTSSPGPIPFASNARCSAAVQELTAMQCFAPTYSANFS